MNILQLYRFIRNYPNLDVTLHLRLIFMTGLCELRSMGTKTYLVIDIKLTCLTMISIDFINFNPI